MRLDAEVRRVRGEAGPGGAGDAPVAARDGVVPARFGGGGERIAGCDGVAFFALGLQREVVIDEAQRADAVGEPHLPAAGDRVLGDLEAGIVRRARLGFGGWRGLGRAEVRQAAVRLRPGAQRQVERAARGVQRQAHGLRRGPDHREVAGGDGDAQPVACGDTLRHVLHRDRDGVAASGFERLGGGVAVAVGQVQHPEADPRAASVGVQVDKAHRHLRDGAVDLKIEGHHRVARELQRLRERRGVEAEAAAVLAALVERRVAGLGVAAPLARGHAHVERRGDRQRARGQLAPCREPPVRAQAEGGARDVGRGP